MNKETYTIPKFKSFKIRFEGIEPIFILKYKKSPNYIVNTERGLFYPIHKLIRKIKHRFEYYNFKSMGIEPEKCEGCGEGWATWMIDDPNGEPYSITCCNSCVNFYDWKMTKRKINFFKQKLVEKKK